MPSQGFIQLQEQIAGMTPVDVVVKCHCRKRSHVVPGFHVVPGLAITGGRQTGYWQRIISRVFGDDDWSVVHICSGLTLLFAPNAACAMAAAHVLNGYGVDWTRSALDPLWTSSPLDANGWLTEVLVSELRSVGAFIPEGIKWATDDQLADVV